MSWAMNEALTAAATRIRAAGGRGAKTALAVIAAIEARGAVDIAGTAPALLAELGVDACPRAAREGLRRLAREVPGVTASGRHEHGAIKIGGRHVSKCMCE